MADGTQQQHVAEGGGMEAPVGPASHDRELPAECS